MQLVRLNSMLIRSIPFPQALRSDSAAQHGRYVHAGYTSRMASSTANASGASDQMWVDIYYHFFNYFFLIFALRFRCDSLDEFHVTFSYFFRCCVDGVSCSQGRRSHENERNESEKLTERDWTATRRTASEKQQLVWTTISSVYRLIG